MAADNRPTAAAPYLPAELIPDIARHLTTLQDFFALRSTCRSYRAVLPPSRAVLASQPPHLLVPHHASSRRSLALVHLPRRRLLRFRAPTPPLPSAVVASDGARVVTFDYFAHELSVTHLLSGERVFVPDTPFLFSRAVLAGDLVFLIAPGWVRYCRLGDGRWREACCRLRSGVRGLYMMVGMLAANGVLYALLNTCQLAIAELRDDKVELKLLGGEVSDHVRNAWMESTDFILGECAGEPLLIFKGLVKPQYKVFRWEPGEQRWVRAMSLGRRTLFVSGNGFDAWLGPDSPGIRGDCIYEALPQAAGWSEYLLVDNTCELVTIDYHGAPELDAVRKQVWVLPSLY
ncbi:hypothetical protein SEVIR_7G011400v4 [Setaria viridis]|uniref:KIB1-4 beta-propeller domain-containing protein n=2 Tax=Setaria TaxID=4554 RepID=K3Y8G1_SETIT|nr:uncharacterized protein LOC101766567 [Setaria italica]XP_034603341.1 uncharacterized protein LOC117863644 [Setaria viridis]XP_034603342.1 uncharacterized protein LOC117863644 [Setaria viridis]RCV32735.1 hypothetical protein SETIT_7G027400v2 [Setaria italica]TKW03231.1 hypothetical protein SEVIR_7G011400v2 [Setaria viridis]